MGLVKWRGRRMAGGDFLIVIARLKQHAISRQNLAGRTGYDFRTSTDEWGAIPTSRHRSPNDN